MARDDKTQRTPPAPASELVQAAAARLAASPDDLGAWLELAAQLGSAGRREQAARAFATLGAVANHTGHVALAVLCARWLTEARASAEAEPLIAAITEAHCRGSQRVDWTRRTHPPRPPGERAPRPPAQPAAPASAEQAIEAAISAAALRVPEKLAPTPLIGALDPADFRELLPMIRVSRRSAGEIVVDVGQPAKALYWIARGAAAVSRGPHALGELWSGAFFGEIALVGGTTRTARVTCSEESWLLELPAQSVERAAHKAPRLARILAEYARARLLANVMRTSELFSRLTEGERAQLLSRFVPRLLAAGTRLIEKGADNDALYVVVSGECEVRDEGVIIATLGVGDGVGEISLLARKPAVADVVVTEPTVVLELSRSAFDEIAVAHPALLAEVYKLVVGRERENRDALIHDAEDLVI
jgi:CRP-like cAMP-binding protein